MKKTLKKMLCGVCSAAMLLGAVTFSASAAHPFTDVKGDQWYANFVDYAYNHGLMAGTSSSTFSPNQTMTRGMLVTVIHAIAGKPAPTTGNHFADVKANDYFAPAVTWCYENGIVAGTGAKTFSPNQKVTREQMVAIMMKFADHTGADVSKRADLSKYSDAGKIEGYAVDAFKWAVASGVISGSSATTLSPKAGAARAECAVVLQRYDELLDASQKPEPEKPTEPAPTEPEVTEPAPTEPKPTEPAPTEPEETKPTVHEHKWEYERTDNLEKWTCSDCGVVATLDPTDLPSVPLHDHKWVWGSLVRAYKCQDCGWQCSEPRAESEGLTLEEYYEREHGSTATPGTHTPKETKSFLMYHPNHDHWMCDKCGIVTSINPIK